jgi:hypothetical protein
VAQVDAKIKKHNSRLRRLRMRASKVVSHHQVPILYGPAGIAAACGEVGSPLCHIHPPQWRVKEIFCET